ncbi:MAG: hypothetical protein H7Y60_06505 [Rhodospirillaceae bacterium]|nr:hypothetical protein [Rhodospirillales bacterium]
MSHSKSRVMEADIKVRMFEHTKANAERNAALAGLSVQEYVRRLIDGHQVRSKADGKAMADLGRLGGVLKMWLVQHPECKRALDEYEGDVRRLLEHIKAVAATVAAPPSERALSIAAEISVMAKRLDELSRLAGVRVDAEEESEVTP